MKHNIVRINKIVLNNFKNVKKGIVEMPAFAQSDAGRPERRNVRRNG